MLFDECDASLNLLLRELHLFDKRNDELCSDLAVVLNPSFTGIMKECNYLELEVFHPHQAHHKVF